jgi:hypothetical protein
MSWNEEREAQLLAAVGNERPVAQETVAKAAEELDVSTRSASAKLRKMGVEVEKVGPRARKYSEEEEVALENFLNDNAGKYTYAEIAQAFAGGKFTAKQIQGKVLSMELTDAVKPTPKPETKKTYTDEEEAVFVKLANGGAFLEDIAEALGDISGMTVDEIAEATGKTARGIRTIITRRGLECADYKAKKKSA